jgi:hypothetical protein
VLFPPPYQNVQVPEQLSETFGTTRFETIYCAIKCDSLVPPSGDMYIPVSVLYLNGTYGNYICDDSGRDAAGLLGLPLHIKKRKPMKVSL